jgi:hypothetical protein
VVCEVLLEGLVCGEFEGGFGDCEDIGAGGDEEGWGGTREMMEKFVIEFGGGMGIEGRDMDGVALPKVNAGVLKMLHGGSEWMRCDWVFKFNLVYILFVAVCLGIIEKGNEMVLG